MDWNKVIDTHGRAFVLYARQWTQNHADAEDIVQTAITRLCQGLPAKREVKLGQIYRAIRNRALDMHKSRQRRLAREGAAAGQLYPSRMFEKDGTDDGISDSVQAALMKLPEDQREVIVMKIWGDLTFREIAEVLATSLNTVASRYRYAIEKLKSSLS